MKKSILAIGMLSMVMVLTSFTTQKVKSADLKTNVTVAYGGGSASGGGIIKLD